MIKSFDDKRTEQIFEGGSPKGFPAELVKRSQTVLDRIDAASTIDDLLVPPSPDERKSERALVGICKHAISHHFPLQGW